jgi:hypothetical protein
MVSELVEKFFKEWLDNNLAKSIKTLKIKVGERELRNFILNHERLPLLKANLIRELSTPHFCIDQRAIKFATEEMAKLFTVIAIKIHDAPKEEKKESKLVL